VVFCHGLLGSKSTNYIVKAALDAFTAWGYNVLVPDLRNSGESKRFSDSPSTGGWKEGQDILCACRFLGEMEQVTSVAAVGYSMGAGAVINAAYQCGQYPYITGGAIAWSGYASMEQMVSHISRRPPAGEPFFPFYVIFAYLYGMRRMEIRRYLQEEGDRTHPDGRPYSPDFWRYIRDIAAPHYGLSEEKIYILSSPAEFISRVEVPLLVVHAEDDPVCPVEEMEELRRAAGGNPNVDIWVLPTGSHCAFDGFDRRWYRSVLRGFLDYWADLPNWSASSGKSGRPYRRSKQG
jgi:predicted alpha/beta-fold hydrolase